MPFRSTSTFLVEIRPLDATKTLLRRDIGQGGRRRSGVCGEDTPRRRFFRHSQINWTSICECRRWGNLIMIDERDSIDGSGKIRRWPLKRCITSKRGNGLGADNSSPVGSTSEASRRASSSVFRVSGIFAKCIDYLRQVRKMTDGPWIKNEEGKAFVHANCVLCNPSERKRPYSRVLYLVLFDTSLESEGVIHETMTTDIVEALRAGMATLTRTNSRATNYKDYVNFLGGYKNGKKDEQGENPEKNFTLSNSSSTSSSASFNSDVPDFSKNVCTSYNDFLTSSKNKKFNSVKPSLDEKPTKSVSTLYNDFENSKNKINEVDEKTTKKSEIYIEVQPAKSVSEVSKMFENKKEKSPPRSNSINSKINIFEKQISTENKPRIAEKPLLKKSSSIKLDQFPRPASFETNGVAQPVKVATLEANLVTPPPKLATLEANLVTQPARVATLEANLVTQPPPEPVKSPNAETLVSPPPPPPLPVMSQVSKPNGPEMSSTQMSLPVMSQVPKPPEMSRGNGMAPPPPPPMWNTTSPKLQATLTKGPQTSYSVNNPTGALPVEIDRNNPLVRKLVYGTLRGMYGAYHDKANDMLATLPKNMVVRSNGVQDRIEQIASNGDLDKLNGRVNPKLEQEP
ncbi:hypothetical protein GEV33_006919 [Tenebrio molitor]|uniref:Uncharacterized protein n=1 Tax=Tenebrio molitor TaxID=7067 RepID=A0A8J6LCS7_TENMO|nr:hypothetical protein GEV33_006919 [Tenebrio molitor]